MKWLGYAMLAAPFVGIFAIVARQIGCFEAFRIFGGMVALVLWIGIAARLVAK